MAHTLSQTQNALLYVANCVCDGKETLLPLFERLEKEQEALQKIENSLQRARALSKNKTS
jgi:hypothetical protein